jgi:hypothetical protein
MVPTFIVISGIAVLFYIRFEIALFRDHKYNFGLLHLTLGESGTTSGGSNAGVNAGR